MKNGKLKFPYKSYYASTHGSLCYGATHEFVLYYKKLYADLQVDRLANNGYRAIERLAVGMSRQFKESDESIRASVCSIFNFFLAGLPAASEYDEEYRHQLCLVPLRAIMRLVELREQYDKYSPFLLVPIETNKPKTRLIDVMKVVSEGGWDSDILDLLDSLKLAFAFIAKVQDKVMPVEIDNNEYDSLLSDVSDALELYFQWFETIGNDDILKIIFESRELAFKLTCALDTLDFDEFQIAIEGLRRCFARLPLALYTLECGCYRKMSQEKGFVIGIPYQNNKDMSRRLRRIELKLDAGNERTTYGLESLGVKLPSDLSKETVRGKWAKGWHGEMIDKVFSSYLNSTGEPFDKICRQVYGAHKQEFDGKGESYDAFKRACDRKKKKAKKRTK